MLPRWVGSWHLCIGISGHVAQVGEQLALCPGVYDNHCHGKSQQVDSALQLWLHLASLNLHLATSQLTTNS